MKLRNYYEILGVTRDADMLTIRQAYRQLARQLHPDVNPYDPLAGEKFREIHEAYEILIDPVKRKAYDSPWHERNRATTETTSRPVKPVYKEGDIADFFEQLFRQHPPETRPLTRKHWKTKVQISLEEAYHGTTRHFSIDGRRREVFIPPGVITGTQIRLEAYDHAYSDLILIMEVLSSERFERRGDDLYTHFGLPLYTALLGGQVGIRSLNGKAVLNIPPETPNETCFRLRDYGMPILHHKGHYGSLYATAHIVLPTRLTDEERVLITHLRDLRT